MGSKLTMESIPGIEDPGDYNRLPAPLVKASIHDLFLDYRYLFSGSREFRQISNKKFRSALIFWVERFGPGYVVIMPNHWWVAKEGEDPDVESIYSIRYALDDTEIYRIGCVHDWKELSPDEARSAGVPHYGRCYHVIRCQKCLHVMAYDSSD